MLNRSCLLASTVATVMAFVCSPTHALPRYSLFDVSALIGPSAMAVEINDAGQVLGRGGGYDTFLYTPGSGVADLAALTGLPAGSSISGYGLNNLGQVIGMSSGGGGRSFIYRPGRPVEYLPEGNHAYTINDAGQYVGARSGDVSDFYRYTPGIGYEQMPLTPILVHLLNDRGDVAGLVYRDSTTEAARYDDNGLQMLGNLGGTYSWSKGINNLGHVVGYSGTAGGLTHAFLYTDAGGMVDLDTRSLGYPTFSDATAINDHGLIGGEFNVPGEGFRAFLTDGASGLVALNTLLDPAVAAHWEIDSVNDINNLGQIVGLGRFNGQQRSFILSVVAAPVPEPGAWLMFLIGLPLLCRFAGRRPGAAPAG